MNIIYKTRDINETDLLNTLKLWNDEKGSIYPITKKAFYQNVINYKEKDVIIAYEEKKIVGFMILKKYDNKKLVDYTNSLFISLFFVSRKYRKNGIGTKLLEFAEERKDGRKLVIGKDIFNFFPGVPTEFDNLTDVWLEKRGFKGTRYTHDLIAYNPINFQMRNDDVSYEYCQENKKEELIDFMLKNKWGRWALEVEEYFNKKSINDENSYIIGIRNSKIISFVKINTYKMDMVPYNVMFQERFEKLGGIGPLGVDLEERKSGLGLDMLSVAISKLREKGMKEMMIDWTGLMELYSKFGFEVWKSYKYMEKDA